MWQVLIYGGSFNPLHKGHEAIIEHCLSLDFDEVWILPSARRSDKPELLDDTIRLEMLEVYVKALDMADKLKVSDFEMKLGQPTETIHTYWALRRAYPDSSFTFVFGTDSIADIPNWRGGAYLTHQLAVIAVERIGMGPICNPLTRMCAYIQEDVAGLSSTHVRKQLSIGADITNEVPLAVAAYIVEHRLYQNI